MRIEFREDSPQIHPTAYIAPNAVIRGDVRIGANTAVLYGAVVTAEGGSVEIGEDCVIMENAVLRGTPGDPLRIGSRVLVGPTAHVSGARLEDDVFVATGAAIFNGVTLERSAEVRIHGVVHVNSRVEADGVVPIGWVAVGDPARSFPASDHDAIWAVQKTLDFPGTVFGVDRSVAKGERTRRYARALCAKHGEDRVV